jgi:predicted hydrocarbon binding protein
MASALSQAGVTALGPKALRATRKALLSELGERGAERLQEIGGAAGDDLYAVFLQWLPQTTGVAAPDDLDAEALSDVLGAFFTSLGWGTLAVERFGSAGLGLASNDWAEADPAEAAEYPSCYVTSGMLADFLTRLAGGNAISIMEVECRSRGEARCRFFAGAPATLNAVYEAMSEGRDYRPVFGD